MSKFILAVPNFSDGRRKEVYEAVVDQVRNVKGVKLLDYHPDPDFNRTVVTLIGSPNELKEAMMKMAEKAIQLIDMEQQSGSHPRIGAQDTIPIFPLAGISLGECIELAEEIGKEVYERLGVPVYFAGENARTAERRSLDYIRKGQYEGLKLVAHTEARRPDIGPAALHPSAGAVIVSAGTKPLVAFNVMLDTNNLDIAKKIAKIVRGPSGGFTTVRSIGLMLEHRDQVCVSMNMFDFEKTPLYRTLETVKMEAARYGVNVIGSEIVGVVAQGSLVNSAEYYLKLENFQHNQILENHLLDLSAEGSTGMAPERAFLEKLASAAPAPGGGSAAAYSGAIASALIAMVARLTIGKQKYADVEGRMMAIASQAERMRAWFEKAVIDDELAFLGVMEARKLPKATDEEKEARAAAIEAATHQAAAVPLQVVENAVKIVHLAREVAETANVNAITDAGSSALMARSAILAAGLNVKSNASVASDKNASDEWMNIYNRCIEEFDGVYSQIQEILKIRAGYELK
jgi:glutamate formiminotransferase